MLKLKNRQHQTGRDFRNSEAADSNAVRQWLEENYDRKSSPAKWECGFTQRVEYQPKPGKRVVRFLPEKYKSPRFRAIMAIGLVSLIIVVAAIFVI